MSPFSALPQTRKLLVLYGSETGTSASLAHDLSVTAERHHFATTCLPANDFASSFSSLSSWPLVLVVVSTTGQGDIPANFGKFWKLLLQKRLGGDWLQGVEFASWGCGDSTYVRFNWAVRKVRRRLLQLGARELGRGEGDEQGIDGIDGAFLPWSTELFKTLLERYPLPPGLLPIPDDQLLPPKYILEFEESTDPSPTPDPKEIMDSLHVPRPNSLLGTITKNTRLTPESHWQDVRHLSISLPTSVSYLPGDTLSLSPKNFPEDVSLFLSLQSWTSIADNPLRLYPSPHIPVSSSPPPIPIPHVAQLTLRTLLTHYLDITSIPRRSFFSAITNMTDDETHKARLKEFTDPQWIDELYDYTTRPRRSILEVLQEFGTVKIPMERLLEVVPRIRERLFSIASSARGMSYPPPSPSPSLAGESDPSKTVDLLVAIVKYKTVIKRLRQGLCTRWLASLPTGAEINILFTKGTLTNRSRLAVELSKPAIMIGPGTGVAPMRALLWERIGMAASADGGGGGDGGRESESEDGGGGTAVMGKNILFFGCRNKQNDYLFHSEWEHLQSLNKLTPFIAFSRDQKQKIYIQHLILQNAPLIYDAIHEKNGVVYVCGSSGRMPMAVREALVEVFEKCGGVVRGVAERELEGLEKDGRWRQETW